MQSSSTNSQFALLIAISRCLGCLKHNDQVGIVNVDLQCEFCKTINLSQFQLRNPLWGMMDLNFLVLFDGFPTAEWKCCSCGNVYKDTIRIRIDLRRWISRQLQYFILTFEAASSFTVTLPDNEEAIVLENGKWNFFKTNQLSRKKTKILIWKIRSNTNSILNGSVKFRWS